MSDKNFPMQPPRPGGELMPDEVLHVVEEDGSWVRTGGCHKGCGACCEWVILPIDKRVLTSPKLADWEKWLNVHNITFSVTDERCEVLIPITCKHLQDDEDKSCGVYGKEERPDMCYNSYTRPYDLINTGFEDVCSYKWTKVTEGED